MRGSAITQYAMREAGTQDACRALEKVVNGATATLLEPRNVISTVTWKVERVIPAGTRMTVVGFSNAGFRGIEVSLREIGTKVRVHGVSIEMVEVDL